MSDRVATQTHSLHGSDEPRGQVTGNEPSAHSPQVIRDDERPDPEEMVCCVTNTNTAFFPSRVSDKNVKDTTVGAVLRSLEAAGMRLTSLAYCDWISANMAVFEGRGHAWHPGWLYFWGCERGSTEHLPEGHSWPTPERVQANHVDGELTVLVDNIDGSTEPRYAGGKCSGESIGDVVGRLEDAQCRVMSIAYNGGVATITVIGRTDGWAKRWAKSAPDGGKGIDTQYSKPSVPLDQQVWDPIRAHSLGPNYTVPRPQ